MSNTGPDMVFTRADLEHFEPRHDSFVGIDSDGCVFDSMETKQKLCFHGLIISHWGLEKIARQVREAAEFVNLYSRFRGQNRFVTLITTFDLLADHPEVKAAGTAVPRLPELRRFIATGRPLGNPELEKAVAETGNAELASLLQWSRDVNREIESRASWIPAFQWALRSLERIRGRSDLICVSQTPTEALVREWTAHKLVPYVRIIAGQELGTKTEHLTLATRGRYAPGRVLMIGDAPGDLKAARESQALFFPVNPGHEEASWERFHEESYDRFLAGTFAGGYEAQLIREFESLLPETPPWRDPRQLRR